ncbi:glycosyltransferase [Yersinia aleksiciae]|uniref:glycosyltransferase n=1 Tax=Yersinia aleksiciae TaxID=263819 RepID=UPI0011A8C8C2|nr:glycosyltransferase [Yersinia aleksiciae]
MTKVDISVIVPVYNCAAYLMDLLDSLRSQSGVSFEIIAVNDGSTDDSLKLLEQIAQIDSRLVIVNQQNQGLSGARNTGLAHASGQWVAFADGDDWLAPNALATWLQQANQQQLDLLIGNGYQFSSDPTQQPAMPLLSQQPWGEILSGQQWIIRSVKQKEWPHYAWLQLIRREVITTHQLQFIRDILHEDILWTTQLALVAQRIGFCASPVYGYRTNPDSITNSPSMQALLRRANSYVDIIKRLADIAASVEPPLRYALFHHANQESTHLLGLLRKRLPASPPRTALARRFIALGLRRVLFRGATNIHELWRALRCSWLMGSYARQKHTEK